MARRRHSLRSSPSLIGLRPTFFLARFLPLFYLSPSPSVFVWPDGNNQPCANSWREKGRFQSNYFAASRSWQTLVHVIWLHKNLFSRLFFIVSFMLLFLFQKKSTPKSRTSRLLTAWRECRHSLKEDFKHFEARVIDLNIHLGSGNDIFHLIFIFPISTDFLRSLYEDVK